MATYAIGDLQGCLVEFEALLDEIAFSDQDHLWLLGDLVNRGPDSLGTLRRVVSMDRQVTVVLGNHDLHLLAIYYGGARPGKSDTFDEILAEPDIAELAGWLRGQKLFHADRKLGYAMSHAGIPHIWSLRTAASLALEVEEVIQDKNSACSHIEFFRNMYGNEPDIWSDDLSGLPRYRLITNYLTRMRVIADSGRLNFSHKGAPVDLPTGFAPWYQHAPTRRKLRLLFGHWAALDGDTGNERIVGLDTGCVWGRKLTALCLETGVLSEVDAIS